MSVLIGIVFGTAASAVIFWAGYGLGNRSKRRAVNRAYERNHAAWRREHDRVDVLQEDNLWLREKLKLREVEVASWISVGVRLPVPSPCRPWLLYCDRMSGPGRYATGTLPDKRWWSVGLSHESVTHWMPLPAPPRGELHAPKGDQVEAVDE